MTLPPPPFGMTLEELWRRREEHTLVVCSECQALLQPAVFCGDRLEAQTHRDTCSRGERPAWWIEEAHAIEAARAVMRGK